MSLITLVKDVMEASYAGKSLQDPRTWTSRATATAVLVSLFESIIPVYEWVFGSHLALSAGDIQAISGGIAVIGILFVDRLHTASNTEAGR